MATTVAEIEGKFYGPLGHVLSINMFSYSQAGS